MADEDAAAADLTEVENVPGGDDADRSAEDTVDNVAVNGAVDDSDDKKSVDEPMDTDDFDAEPNAETASDSKEHADESQASESEVHCVDDDDDDDDGDTAENDKDCTGKAYGEQRTLNSDHGDRKSVAEACDGKTATSGEDSDDEDNDFAGGYDVEEVEPSDTKADKSKSQNGIDAGDGKISSPEEDEIHELSDEDDEMSTTAEESARENGTVQVSPKTSTNDVEIIDLATPSKDDQPKNNPTPLTPRRSSRNINRTPVKDHDDEMSSSSDSSGIEEILPEDPLGSADLTARANKFPKNSPTVIDSKKIAELAASLSKAKNLNSAVSISAVNSSCPPLQPLSTAGSMTTAAVTNMKKEPTLVIIDTNSILSGRSSLPMSTAHKSSPSSSATFSTSPAHHFSTNSNMRATITPIPPLQKTLSAPTVASSSPMLSNNLSQQPAILPSLTDDMFVVEAPSFIVPYVYEKPPVNDLKKYLTVLKGEIQKAIALAEKEAAALKAKSGENGGGGDDDGDDYDDRSEKSDDAATKKGTDNKFAAGASTAPATVATATHAMRKHLFFDSPIGKFFTDIGIGLVQEYVQTDLLKQQKRKRDRERGKNMETNRTINSLMKSLELTKENNGPYHLTLKKCEFCSFRTESALAMAYHLETPHLRNFIYKCNCCPYEVRSPHDILFHMEAEHCVRGRLERAPLFHQCPSCPFEDNQKGKLSRHLVACARKFKPERNLEPPLDWEPPAKIPRMPRMKTAGLNMVANPMSNPANAAAAAAMYQAIAKSGQYHLLPKLQSAVGQQQVQPQPQLQHQQMPAQQQAVHRGRGRPALGTSPKAAAAAGQLVRNATGGVTFKQNIAGGGSVLLPNPFQQANQLFQHMSTDHDFGGRIGTYLASHAAASGIQMQNSPTKAGNTKSNHQPSISITPLPRGTTATPTHSGVSGSSSSPSSTSVLPPGITAGLKPGDSVGTGKNSFVICEICDGYIKDLEQLRNHMQWIHKVKIHPKMIYNRPPLNCQKCQFRFFTDQGLERHLLGSHGLVTSSMQEAANKSKDSGRCPVCGRQYQWKLLNHVARDHNMTLKPAHLSYKCTVCTATFGMYKQFENHVYSAHSVVAKRVMDKKQQQQPQQASNSGSTNLSSVSKTLLLGGSNSGGGSAAGGESILKPLKINDEITIIPQMPKSAMSSNGTLASLGSGISITSAGSHVSKAGANKVNQVIAAAMQAAQAVVSANTSVSISPAPSRSKLRRN